VPLSLPPISYASDLLQTIPVLLIPVGTIAFGDIIARAWLKEVLVSKVNRLLSDFVLGTVIFLSCLLFGGLVGALVPTEMILGVVLGGSFAYSVYDSLLRRRRGVHLPKLGWLDWAAAAVFLGYVTKVLLVLATKPIQDADAMAVYIPMGRVFTTLGRIPVFDPFHYWTFTGEPGVSLMYSWALTLSGSSQSEAFRVIPVLPFVLLPLAVYAFVQRTFKNRTAASIALIVTVFMPGLDFLLFYYSFYLDAYALALMLIAWTLYQGIPSEKLHAELLVGMCLGSLLLIKYDYGLFTTATVLLLMISRAFINPMTRRVVRTALVAAVSAVFVVGANSLWGLLSGGYTVYLPIVILVGTLIVVSYHLADEMSGRVSIRSVGAVFPFMIPAFIWQIRNIVAGGTLFGIPFLRVSGGLQGAALAIALHASQGLPGAVQGAALNIASYNWVYSFGRFTILEPFLHPWYNLFFLPVSILAVFYAARKRSSRLAVLLFLAYFLYFLTVIGDFPSGRHLMFAGLMEACAVGLLLADFRLPKLPQWQYPTLIFYCATSLLAWPTIYFFMVGQPGYSLFQRLGAIPYALSEYDSSYSLSNFSQHFLPFYGALAVAVLLAYLLYRSASNSKHKTAWSRAGKAFVIILVLVGSFIQFTPYLALASSDTNGNILNFSNVGSFYQSDLNVTATVVKLLPANSTIITYGNVALAYTYPKVLDLYRGGEPYLNEILQGQEGENVSRALLAHGFDFLLLPSSQNSQFDSFMRFVDSAPALRKILADPWIVLVKPTFTHWLLYEVTAPS